MTKYRFLTIFLSGVFLMIGFGCRKNVVVPPPEPEPVGGEEAKNLIVLLSDPDGNVGEITVASARGSQLITRAGYGCEIAGSNNVVERPKEIEVEEIIGIFGEALDARPEPPLHFLLHFRVETASLDKKSLSAIPEILQAIAERKSAYISIVGHTDTSGPEDYNFTLSRERALNVKNRLISEGVNPDILEITYHGEHNPLIKTGDNVFERQNRRVEVVVR